MEPEGIVGPRSSARIVGRMEDLQQWYEEYEEKCPILTRKDARFMIQFPPEFKLWPTMFYERYPGLRPTRNPQHYCYGTREEFGYGWHLRPGRYLATYEGEFYDDYSRFVRLWPTPENHGRRVNWKEAQAAVAKDGSSIVGTLLTRDEVKQIPPQVITRKRSQFPVYDGWQELDPTCDRTVIIGTIGSTTSSSPIIVSADQDLLDRLRQARLLSLSTSATLDNSGSPLSSGPFDPSDSGITTSSAQPRSFQSFSSGSGKSLSSVVHPVGDLLLTSSPIFAKAHTRIIRRDPDWGKGLRRLAPHQNLRTSIDHLKNKRLAEGRPLMSSEGEVSERQARSPSEDQTPPESLIYISSASIPSYSAPERDSDFPHPSDKSKPLAQRDPVSERCPTPGAAQPPMSGFTSPPGAAAPGEDWDPDHGLIFNPDILNKSSAEIFPVRAATRGGGKSLPAYDPSYDHRLRQPSRTPTNPSPSGLQHDPATFYSHPQISQDLGNQLFANPSLFAAFLQFQSSMNNPEQLPPPPPKVQPESLREIPAREDDNVNWTEVVKQLTTRIGELEQKNQAGPSNKDSTSTASKQPPPKEVQTTPRRPTPAVSERSRLSDTRSVPRTLIPRDQSSAEEERGSASSPASPLLVTPKSSTQPKKPPKSQGKHKSRQSSSTKLVKRSVSPFDPNLMPKLKKMMFKPREIVQNQEVMSILDKKEIGKPLAAYIRDMAAPNRPTRFKGWKGSDSLPVSLEGKKDKELSTGELQTLMDYGPSVRKDWI
ncbi:uncharacterized protein N7518_002779 [Penicillium psychrosexuale]|uniref:uncharacterized protein n=1 Tax=Penicillium psychrosexuale TaxID=1002107 RepID=UPI0025454989|nr:uncharacterized protein N7518_002779 [Penicillium psychrosexuale]KAJ5800711.1 hypothetical protein N7518_002779 [Penicillium psychrosexuale]